MAEFAEYLYLGMFTIYRLFSEATLESVSCEDSGWLWAINGYICPFENTGSQPVIVYSDDSEATVFNETRRTATVLAVFIRKYIINGI